MFRLLSPPFTLFTQDQRILVLVCIERLLDFNALRLVTIGSRSFPVWSTRAGKSRGLDILTATRFEFAVVSGEKLELANSMYRFAGSPEAFIVLQVYRGSAGPTDPAGNSIAEDGTFLKEVSLRCPRLSRTTALSFDRDSTRSGFRIDASKTKRDRRTVKFYSP